VANGDEVFARKLAQVAKVIPDCQQKGTVTKILEVTNPRSSKCERRNGRQSLFELSMSAADPLRRLVDQRRPLLCAGFETR
jgi:hypothetical protein